MRYVHMKLKKTAWRRMFSESERTTVNSNADSNTKPRSRSTDIATRRRDEVHLRLSSLVV
ncbi:hypothetical protein JB92DRAFT_2909697 [Gautieria morchelliformis]|nr:hypothetical protein JB92DRAFT_2909697 [Gautieria morchelliformis]